MLNTIVVISILMFWDLILGTIQNKKNLALKYQIVNNFKLSSLALYVIVYKRKLISINILASKFSNKFIKNITN